MVLQVLRRKPSFQAKASSNLKSTIQSFLTQANSAEYLLSAVRCMKQDLVKNLRTLKLLILSSSRWISAKVFMLNFNPKTDTFQRKFWLLLFFFLISEFCRYQNSHQSYLMVGCANYCHLAYILRTCPTFFPPTSEISK